MTHDFSVCCAGERGDGGEAGGPVPTRCFQHGDAGLQENPGESLSDGLEPQHVQHVVASADTNSHSQTEGGPACVQTQIRSICSSVVFASRLQFKHGYQHVLAEARRFHLEQFFRLSSPDVTVNLLTEASSKTPSEATV